MESTIFPTRTYVNGSYLHKFVGKSITLIATVLKIGGNEKSLTLQTTDNQVVKVNFQETVDSEIDSLVEVQGYVADKTTINGTYYINLPSTITHDFDKGNFDETVKFINNITNPFK
ncbi:uncharacterized protein LOC126902708 [Daktulosphaira vitifoliae]|uniref:uncharacterized protein LOC126902708 n=1 Tax=Daktulosphaira vitifoliae TaxID=58002 RepID=UPI0021AA6981|nr:uncharacterized protein LOC126902708 [Daktulosphaira vitifoliae]